MATNDSIDSAKEREAELLRELAELRKLGACSAADGDRASALIRGGAERFNYMSVGEAVDLALELGRVS